jgi:hypothetical protein
MSGTVQIRLATVLLLVVSATSLGVSLPLPLLLPPPATSNPSDAGPVEQQYAVSTRRDRIGRIIAPVMINGRGPFHFMLDTGSNRTVLAASALAKLELLPDPGVVISVAGVTGSEIAPTVRVESLDAGDLHFRDLALPVLSGPVFYDLDGILGMDGFEGLQLSADFIRDRITITRSRGRRASLLYTVIPVEFLSERLLMIDSRIGRVHAKAIIDTGGTHTLGNPALLAALISAGQTSARPLESGVIDATQTVQSGVMGRVPSVKLGAATIQNLDIAFGDFQIFRSWGLENVPAVLIGMDVLGTLADLSIDYRRKEVDVRSRPTVQSMMDRKGISLTDW